MELLLFLPFFLAFLLIRGFYKKRGFALGVSSDAWITIQFVIVSCYSPFIFFLLLSVSVPYVLFDAMLQKKMGIRMRFSLLYHMKYVKNYWVSAKELGIVHFLAFTTLWVLISAFLALKIPSGAPSGLFLGIGGGMLLTFAALCRTAKYMERYQFLHPLVLEEIEALFALFLRKKSPKGNWQPFQEEYFRPSLEFPLYRLTKTFKGKKSVPLELAPGETPHVIILFLESFRAKSLHVCDPTANEEWAPHFNRLAKEGVLWRQFYCASARTCKALMATLFGVSSKGDSEIFKNNPSYPLRGLPEIFKEHKYCNVLLQGGDLGFDSLREFGREHHFDILEGAQEISAHYQHEFRESVWGLHDEFVMRRAIEVLRESDQAEKPIFMNIFTISNHHPWRLPPGEGEQKPYASGDVLEGRFHQTLHYTDRCLGMFVDELKQAGLLKKTLLFVTGDHGQGFSEHGDSLLDREGLYDEYIRVPLLLLTENRGLTPIMCDEIGSHQDVLPTLLDLFQFRTLHHAMGRSLLRMCPEAAAFFHSPCFPPRFGLRKGPWKWIVNPRGQEEELYNLLDDPNEKCNLIKQYAELKEALRGEATEKKEFLEELFEKGKLCPAQSIKEEEQAIDLRGKKELRDEDLQAVADKIFPTSLRLDDCDKITDTGLLDIATRCTRLKTLSVRNCLQINEGLVAICRQASDLRNFDISHCLLLDEGCLEKVFSYRTALDALFMEGLSLPPGKILEQIVRNTPHLTALSMLETEGVRDDDITKIVSHCKTLQFLRLCARQLTDQSLIAIAKECHTLRTLHFSACAQLTDEGLAQLQGCRNLYALTLSEGQRLSGKFLKNWRRLFLSHISFSDMPDLDDEALGYLLDHPLHELSLSDCPRISNEAVMQLGELHATTIHIVRCPQIAASTISHLRKTTQRVFWSS